MDLVLTMVEARVGLEVLASVFYTDNKFRSVPLIHVMSGVGESRKTSLIIGAK